MSTSAEGTGSARYSKGTLEFQRIAAAFAVFILILVYREEGSSVAAVAFPLFSSYCGIAAVIYAGQAWVNRSERNPEFQAALATRESRQIAPPTTPASAGVLAARTDDHDAAILPPAARGRP